MHSIAYITYIAIYSAICSNIIHCAYIIYIYTLYHFTTFMPREVTTDDTWTRNSTSWSKLKQFSPVFRLVCHLGADVSR